MLNCSSCIPLFATLYSLPGSSAHRVLQVRIQEWVAMPSSRGSSQPRHWTCVSYPSCISRFFTTSITWEARIKVTSCYIQSALPICRFGICRFNQIIHPRLVDSADAKLQIHKAHCTVFWNLPFFQLQLFLRFLHGVLWNKGHWCFLLYTGL